jgi:DNA transformation protein
MILGETIQMATMISDYVLYILDLLTPYGAITSRAMFGGYGIYKNQVIIGIIVDDELYFKVDQTNQTQYEEMGSVPFTYNRGDKLATMSYWKVPIEIMEDEEILGHWLDDSYRISLKSKKGKSSVVKK